MRLVLLVLVMWVAAPAATAEGTDEPAFAAIDNYLAEHHDRTGSPGLAYAIVRDGRVVHQQVRGVDGDGHPVTENTPFLLGSISKSFTSTATLQLVATGALNLDEPVVTQLPWFRLADTDTSDRITVRHLLTHTSGISTKDGLRLADRFDNSAGGIDGAVRDLAEVTAISKPGAVHHYSDANYMVLGALVAEVSGRPYAAYLRTNVLEPLAMTDAVTSAEQAADRLPAGYRYVFGGERRFDPGYDGSGLPYGYLGASLEDVTHFAIAQLSGGRYSNRQLLPAGLVAQAQEGEAQTAGGSYGFGWRISTVAGERVVWHSGATPGFMSTLVLVPDEELAVIVLHNAYGPARDAQLNSAAFNVVRLLTGHDVEIVGADPMLRTAPWILLGIAGLVLLGAAKSGVVRCLRGGECVATRAQRRRCTRSSLGWGLGCVVLALLVGWALPATQDVDLRRTMLWTPDIALGIGAVLLACGLTIVLQSGKIAGRALKKTRC